MKKYKYIILPPEMLHLSMSNLISDGRKSINDILFVVNQLITDDEEYLIKYRTLGDFKKHPSKENY